MLSREIEQNDCTDGLRSLNVAMSNSLARASHALTLVEKRILAGAIAKVDSRKGSVIHSHLAQFEKVRITAIDYSEAYGVDLKNAYEQMRKAADQIFDRQFSIKEITEKGERVIRQRWVSSIVYAKNEGFIELRFSPEIYPHLNILRKQYTTYKLRNASSFRSSYSWRLYEVARSWVPFCSENNKSVTITLDNLKHQLEYPDTYRWDHVRKRVLEPATNEINKLSDLEISYSLNKKGKSIYSIDFIFCVKIT